MRDLIRQQLEVGQMDAIRGGNRNRRGGVQKYGDENISVSNEEVRHMDNFQPKDWDVATNATPEQIIAIFPKTFYENTFGTVGIVNEELEEGSLKVIEVTPYRIESDYTDNRHPDKVTFSQKLEDGIKEVVEWYKLHKENIGRKHSNLESN